MDQFFTLLEVEMLMVSFSSQNAHEFLTQREVNLTMLWYFSVRLCISKKQSVSLFVNRQLRKINLGGKQTWTTYYGRCHCESSGNAHFHGWRAHVTGTWGLLYKGVQEARKEDRESRATHRLDLSDPSAAAQEWGWSRWLDRRKPHYGTIYAVLVIASSSERSTSSMPP
jgi:hypothetical protein